MALPGLRIEHSSHYSGKLINFHKIEVLKEKSYKIEDIPLDGDAPKQFICVYEYKNGRKKCKGNRKVWVSYIAKTAEKWYPHESIIEYAINRIGESLGLNMNETRLVVANSQIRFLSKFFLNLEKETLVHGADICAEHFGNLEEAIMIANDKNQARKHFTFEFVKDAIRLVFPNAFEPLMKEFVKMLVFDAIVGNNDRHFYNWGVKRSINSIEKMITFAPLYDSARGLMWNLSEENIKKYLVNYDTNGGTLFSKYLTNSCPRISIDANKTVNHFDLVEFLKNYSNENSSIVCELISEVNERKILTLLNEEIFIYFTEERKRIITLVIEKRFEILRSLCYVVE
ncbi:MULTISPECIES: HipA domain-containing protein [Sphingobacterium]|uniref:HipA domain-containing protein n=1 Tax=Sphingobacterium TaxID=28453 RepID=UPI00257D6203|nr:MULTISPECIES: HipA domain-containing protein [Sphingobacterium]